MIRNGFTNMVKNSKHTALEIRILKVKYVLNFKMTLLFLFSGMECNQFDDLMLELAIDGGEFEEKKN